MAILDQLRNLGWYLSEEGLEQLQKISPSSDAQILTHKALDVDIREIGSSILATELNKTVIGPIVLQILKVRNVSAPKSKPNSQGAPRMLKLNLTDGHTNCQGVEVKSLSGVSLDHTAPGTKVLINGASVVSGCLFLEAACCKVLGGNVAPLVEKWQVSKLMPNHIRGPVNEDGPPPWVNFGMKIINTISNQTISKSLENKNKETKVDSEFQEQRKEAISEAIQGAVKKVFGGGIKPPNTFNPESGNQNFQQRAPRPPRKPREKLDLEKQEKPTQKVSLFNFLEDKLPPGELAQIKSSEKPDNNYEEPRTDKPRNRNPVNRPYREAGNYRERKQPYRQDEQTYNKFEKFNSDAPKFYNQKFTEPNPRYNQDNRYPDLNSRYTPDAPRYQDISPRYNVDNSRYNADNTRYNADNSRYNADSSRYNADNSRYNADNSRYNADNSRYSVDNTRYNADNRFTDYSQYQDNHRYEQKYPEPRFNPEPNPRYNDSNRFYNDKPPRFQKQRNENANTSKFQSAPSEPKSKPKTNMFVDKIALEINNISLYNNKYESEKLKINHKPTEDPSDKWQWKSGDRCLAKYWEDNKFYNAVVTEVTNGTCMVEFLEYGNFEEVLHCDCIPITSDKLDQQYMKSTDNQEYFSTFPE